MGHLERSRNRATNKQTEIAVILDLYYNTCPTACGPNLDIMWTFGGHLKAEQDMQGSRASEAFVSELRHVLQHLYDPAALRKSPLLDALARSGQRAVYNPLSALRRTLTEAILSLRPGSDVPAHANAWRVYHVLTWRYVEQSDQRDVAANLAISPRQLRRLEWDAVRVLADVLWTRYDLGQWEQEKKKAESMEGALPGNGVMPAREQELAWLKASFPSETADVSELIASITRTISPLVEASGTQVAYEPCRQPCLVTGQLASIRQALLNLITAAVHSAPGGEVRVDVQIGEQGVTIHVRVRHAHGTGEPPGTEVAEHLQMVQQLIPLCGGQLDVPSGHEEGLPFWAALTLPVSREAATVLAIDDNLDTLRLLERYLSGTPYAFVGTRDPEQVIALAERLMPQVILLDIMLPGIDGWELLGRLREHPQIGEVPVLVCSILPQAKLAATLGAAAYLRKPISRQALLEALRRTASG